MIGPSGGKCGKKGAKFWSGWNVSKTTQNIQMVKMYFINNIENVNLYLTTKYWKSKTVSNNKYWNGQNVSDNKTLKMSNCF